MVLLLIKILFVFKISRRVNWIFLTLERVSIILLTQPLGAFNNSYIFGGPHALFRRFHIHRVPDIRSICLHLPYLRILFEIRDLLHLGHLGYG